VSYRLALSLSADGMSRDALTRNVPAQTAVLGDRRISELDATAVFPARVVPGEDYVGIHLWLSPVTAASVLGLRLRYEATDGGPDRP
jgi:hypothetical protein